jgi:large subunit ribosomal protein L19
MANNITWISHAPTPVSKPTDESQTKDETKATTSVEIPKPFETRFHVGDTIRVHYRLIEKEKEAGKAKKQILEKLRERIQVFEGIVISIKGSKENASFTVRRIGTDAIGIERIFPIMSPWIKKIEVKKKGDVRRAKLYYIRERTGKRASIIKERVEGEAKKKAKKTTKKAVKK